MEFSGRLKNTIMKIRYIQLATVLAIIRAFAQKRKIKELLENRSEIKLELGESKSRMEGWLTVDCQGAPDLLHDLRQPFPFPDGSVDQIYSSHVIEYFDYQELLSHLSEIRRMLKPGGVFRVAVPNARIYLDAYFHSDSFDVNYYCRYAPAFHYHSPIDIVNYIAYMAGYHRRLFDEAQLLAILKSAGFRNVASRAFDENIDLEDRRYESIYARAER